MTDAPGGKTPLWEHCHCTKGTGEYEKKTARHPACVGRAAFGGTGRIPRAGPRAGAQPAHPPHGTHRRGADAGGAVHYRHRGQLCCHGQGLGRHRPHPALPRHGLAPADRRYGGETACRHEQQLCGAGRGRVCGLVPHRHPPQLHPERLRPPCAGCGQEPLCALQPLGQ